MLYSSEQKALTMLVFWWSAAQQNTSRMYKAILDTLVNSYYNNLPDATTFPTVPYSLLIFDLDEY